VSCAGLVPVMRLARTVGLHAAVADRVRLPGDTGSSPAGKVATIVAGMLAGADSINDLDIIRHGGMPSLSTSLYAPSTIGSFLRSFTHGHVRQLHAAACDTLVALARLTTRADPHRRRRWLVQPVRRRGFLELFEFSPNRRRNSPFSTRSTAFSSRSAVFSVTSRALSDSRSPTRTNNSSSRAVNPTTTAASSS
jgi:hypothetical protein